MIYPVPSFNSQRNKIGKPANTLDEFRKRKKFNPRNINHKLKIVMLF